MPNLYMGEGTFRFEQIVLDRMIEPGQAGNYVLGYKDENGEFVPRVIGRSDTDLRAELMSKLVDPHYPYFKFSTSNPRWAFQLECAQFHNFRGKIENQTHPVSPEGPSFRCFLCGQ
ncbi:MAG: hypothetical protein JRN09_06135 [Nitrososphaerota archaeon]|nr:hypothetical protein [Nitrososphaerota archaeon]